MTLRVHVLQKWVYNPYRGIGVDTTSNSGPWRDLSPFVLSAPPARNLENLWQFSKVYPEHIDQDGNPNKDWRSWSSAGFADPVARRYPMGKGAVPEYLFWRGEHLGYIQARKKVYALEYSRNVILTQSYAALRDMYSQCLIGDMSLMLWDYDAYDHIALGMSLREVINNPDRKMGHGFVLAMMLEGVLGECLEE